MLVLLFLIVHWYVSLFFQTVFLHRYASHRMFSMSPFMEKVFFVLTYLCQGSSYLSPYAYGAMHRMHHAYADTENDPHSPKYAKNIWDMMMQTKNFYLDILRERVQLDSKFTKHLPQWRSFDLWGNNWISRVVWGLLYVYIYTFIATEWWMYLALPIHFLMGPIHGAIINWFAHKVGYTNYNVKDTSKNIVPVDLLMCGEALHNNHHKNGTRPNFGVKWFELDPVYPILYVLDILGLIKLRKVTAAPFE